ncbi:hypothetical protein FJZ26_05995 [Candidatus Parvarchaeota archaeon]|nr:hypothetical protein [Candidatus Parvarchaeota archaeon]
MIYDRFVHKSKIHHHDDDINPKTGERKPWHRIGLSLFMKRFEAFVQGADFARKPRKAWRGAPKIGGYEKEFRASARAAARLLTRKNLTVAEQMRSVEKIIIEAHAKKVLEGQNGAPEKKWLCIGAWNVLFGKFPQLMAEFDSQYKTSKTKIDDARVSKEQARAKKIAEDREKNERRRIENEKWLQFEKEQKRIRDEEEGRWRQGEQYEREVRELEEAKLLWGRPVRRRSYF